MKTVFPFLIVALIAFAGCNKDSGECNLSDVTGTATNAEVQHIDNYMFTQGITTFIQLPSGVFIDVHDYGDTAVLPETCTQISFTYQGKLMDSSTVFETNTTGVVVLLGQLIKGMQYGLKEVGTGAHLNIYIPPSLAYGSQQMVDTAGAVIIPPFSYLNYEVDNFVVH